MNNSGGYYDIYRQAAKDAYEMDLNNVSIPKGYRLDRTFSNGDVKVLVNDTDKKLMVAYKGTDIKNNLVRDVVADLYISKNKQHLNPHFREADDVFKKVKAEYPDYEKVVLGHSKGGSLAYYVNQKNKGDIKESIGYARGEGIINPFNMFNPLALIRLKKPDNQTDFKNAVDLVSLGQFLQWGGKNFTDYTYKDPLTAHKEVIDDESFNKTFGDVVV